MRPVRLAVTVLAVVCSVSFVAQFSGCTSAPERPKTVKVLGKVIKGGQPLSKVTVTLQPKEEGTKTSPRRPVIGETNDMGEFTVSSFEPNDGAPPGEYRAVLASNEEKKNPDDKIKDDRIPKKYLSADTSDLIVTVPSDKPSVEVVLELK